MFYNDEFKTLHCIEIEKYAIGEDEEKKMPRVKSVLHGGEEEETITGDMDMSNKRTRVCMRYHGISIKTSQFKYLCEKEKYAARQ